MRLLFLGDVVGRPGRDAIAAHLPGLRRDLKLDFVVINGENAAGGFGITQKICEEFYALGADVVTTGNHAWDQRETLSYINTDPRLLRPVNYPPGAPGKGGHVYTTQSGRKVLVVNVMGRLFMDPLDDPFQAVSRELARNVLGGGVQAVIVDMHAEATSEKMAMGHFCDGRASLVVGTHTHIPTADAQILPGGTAFQGDAGMCGDYLSVIGMDKTEPMRRFVTGMTKDRFTPAMGAVTVSGVYIETDDATGRATRIEMVRQGGRLEQSGP